MWVSTPVCTLCGKAAQVEITEDEFEGLQRGEFVQDVFATRDAAFRELFISGIHEHCWEVIFADSEE